jgi:ABC-2 type transport system ATP-binding protein
MLESPQAVETHDLRKVYRNGFVAVDSLSLSVARGQIFGFLGPNGAGKTTTINMLIGNVQPTSGSGSLLGAKIGDIKSRSRLGFLPEKFQFHEFLSAYEFLDLHGKLYGMPHAVRVKQIPKALEMVGLSARSRSKIREFSKGMQQRVGLAQAILNDPDLVILDEPTSALDPIGRRDVRDLIRQLKESGKTIILNSHLLGEIELTCDEVAILKQGKIVRQGKIQDLLAAPSHVTMRVLSPSPDLLEKLRQLTHTLSVADDPEIIVAGISHDDQIPELVSTIVNNGGRLMSLVPQRESLEDLFIRIVEEE